MFQSAFCVDLEIFFIKDEKFAEKIVGNGNDDLGNQFGDFIVHTAEGHGEKHNTHVYQQGTDARKKECKGFPHLIGIPAGKNIFAIGEIGEGHSGNPRDHIGNLELQAVVWIEEGDNAKVIDSEADDGGQDADD